MRKAEIKMHDVVVGHLIEDENGYHFQYEKSYRGEPISKTLPLRTEAYSSSVLFPFFDGLIPEGWLLEIVEKNWKLNPRDRMGTRTVMFPQCLSSFIPVSCQMN